MQKQSTSPLKSIRPSLCLSLFPYNSVIDKIGLFARNISCQICWLVVYWWLFYLLQRDRCVLSSSSGPDLVGQDNPRGMEVFYQEEPGEAGCLLRF